MYFLFFIFFFLLFFFIISDYFGFFISSDFENGHSKGISTTYNNPSLSSQSEFKLDAIEVWLVKEKERDDRLIDDKKLKQQGTVLNRMGMYI